MSTLTEKNLPKPKPSSQSTNSHDHPNTTKKIEIIYSKYSDLVPIFVKDNNIIDNEQVDYDLIDKTTRDTKAALDKIVNTNVRPKQCLDSKFIKYKPCHQSSAFNSGAKERIIKTVEMPVDPLDPPKFKYKKVPRGSGSPPVPVIHSPPRALTVEDQDGWRIPPCVSDWKNPKGYAIPLDKRLAADCGGRGLQEVRINDNFPKLSESLYVAEQKAREAVVARAKLENEMRLKEKERKDMELLEVARKARFERTGLVPSFDHMPVQGGAINDNDTSLDYMQRENIREEKRKERKRERILEAKDQSAMQKKSKVTRDRDRDINEKVALGMASTGARRGCEEVTHDQRLFNQDKGMDSGFVATDDAYNIYDKCLFAAGSSAIDTLYRPKKDEDDEMYGGVNEEVEKLMKSERFKADKAFAGTSKTGTRDRPVEFEKDRTVKEEDDPFGLSQLWPEMKKTGSKTKKN